MFTLYHGPVEKKRRRRTLLVIESWQWDDGNLQELQAHGVSRRTVLQVAAERPKFRKNKRARAASHQMIGPDAGGAFWTICIREVTGQPGLWRAITAWSADPEDVHWHRRSG